MQRISNENEDFVGTIVSACKYSLRLKLRGNVKEMFEIVKMYAQYSHEDIFESYTQSESPALFDQVAVRQNQILSHDLSSNTLA